MYLPTTQWIAVAPGDTTASDLMPWTTQQRITNFVYVGGLGDVACVDQSGTAVVFTAVPAGTQLRVGVRRINQTGTSASGLVACYWE